LSFWRRIKLQRLKTRSQFQAVLAGSTVARTAHFALHCAALDTGVVKSPATSLQTAPPMALFVVKDVWMGAMVPKRWAKKAVTRNAIKRQIYNVSTDYESALTVAAHVVRLRSGFDRKQFISASSELLKDAVRLELQQLFAKIVQRSPLAPGQRVAA
jgi:ribonuclease P protein component